MDKDVKLRCMIVDDDELALALLRQYIEHTANVELKHACTGAIEAYNILQKDNSIDILFLDIEMPEMSGLELIPSISSYLTEVVLVTGREKYAVEAFEYDVSDYLVKPIAYARFLKAVSKILDNRKLASSEAEDRLLFVRANHKIIKIDAQDITHIEALSDYIIIHTNEEKLIVHSTMKGIVQRLEVFKTFSRVHRSFIVNIIHIKSVKDTSVMVGDIQIPIGRSYKVKFLEKLNVL